MRRFELKLGETATPSRPRSELVQMLLAEKVSAAVGNSEPFWMTRSAPLCVVASSRPSGVKAIAVGDDTLATRVSLKPGGRAATGTANAPESAPAPASFNSSLRYRTKGLY